MKYKYCHSILGGTFDHLHKGHKYFLDSAFRKSCRVTIGLACGSLLNNKLFLDSLEDYNARLKSLKDFLRRQNYLDRCRIIQLEDIYGNSLLEKEIDAIFVTENLICNAQEINDKRAQIDYPALEIEKVLLLCDEEGNMISSTRIRSGEIDREGCVYKDLFLKHETLVLPHDLRQTLRKPYGEVVSDTRKLEKIRDESFVIAVGDIVVSELVRNVVTPNVSLYDLRTERHAVTSKHILEHLPEADVTICNGQGVIERSAVERLYSGIRTSLQTNKKIALKVVGEEDLLALPAVLLAPLGSVVLYGMLNKGAVVVRVTEDKKREFVDLAKRF